MTNKRRRRAVVLLFVLLGLALAAALLAPLATSSGLSAVAANQEAERLRHRLAAESMVALLADLLAADPQLNRELERRGAIRLDIEVGSIAVTALVQDDTAKLPLASLAAEKGLATLRAAIDELGQQQGLAGRVSTDVERYTGCLEDVLAGSSDAAIYGRPDIDAPSWTRLVSPIGQRLEFRKAPVAVLTATLRDIQPGLGAELARRRTASDAPLGTLLAELELTEAQRRAATMRLTDRTERFSLLVRTTLGTDARQWYFVCDPGRPPQVLLDWEVAP